ncbi:MAG: helix-turn-helix domain-containing protein [Selenomonas sp.]|nr:helix-turn-helix domain-containing protein [Selenomonas sp.]
MKQQDVADTLGVSRSTYANYETGRRAPDIDLLMRLADLYGITLDELTGHASKQSPRIQLTNQALRLLKSFNQLPAAVQEWYIAHMALDAKMAQDSLKPTTSTYQYEQPLISIVADNDHKK